MDFKINFQDLASYIVPGALLLILLYWFLGGFLDLSYRIDATNWMVFAVALILCYVLGHLVQAIGNVLEPRYEEGWGGKYSDQLLRLDDSYFDPQFKAKLRNTIESVFSLPLPTSRTTEAETMGQRQAHEQAFRLCHSLLLQEDAAQQSDIFQGLYGLYRGLMSVGLVGLGLTFLIGAKHAALLGIQLSGSQLPRNDLLVFDQVQLVSAAVIFFAILLTRPLLASRLERFARHYASAVYQGFFSWCVKKRLVP